MSKTCICMEEEFRSRDDFAQLFDQGPKDSMLSQMKWMDFGAANTGCCKLTMLFVEGRKLFLGRVI